MRYAARVQGRSVDIAGLPHEGGQRAALPEAPEQPRTCREMTGQRKVVLILFGLAFLIMIVSVIPWSDLGITRIADAGLVVPRADRAVPVLRHRDRHRRAHGRAGADQRIHRRRARPAGRGAGRRPGARRLGHHEQRADHRHGAALGRTARQRHGWRGLHQHRGADVSAAVVPDPVVLGPGDGDACPSWRRWRTSPACRGRWW